MTSVKNWRGRSKSPLSLSCSWVAVRVDLLGLQDKSCNLFSIVCNWCNVLGGLLAKEADILSSFFGSALQKSQQEFKKHNAEALGSPWADLPQATLVLW